MKKILVTGGAGYIGSHTCVELLDNNFEVTVLDNFSNSSRTSFNHISELTSRKIDLIEGDLKDKKMLRDLFVSKKFDAVIHFAALKSIEDSIKSPLVYYENNVLGTINLLRSMEENSIKKLVFSSSATVYGIPKSLPIKESASFGKATNAYGRTKQIIENLLTDITSADLGWSVATLRYFNPVGAHSSGLLGDRPLGKPSNLMPMICEVASGAQDYIEIYGDNYNTSDGTGLRDYIHVVDLAMGHISAMNKILSEEGLYTVNLGTGKGYTVLEILKAFEKVNNIPIPYKIVDRRSGDVPECYADVVLAQELLNWKAKKNLEEMCKDSWQAKIII